MFHPFPLHQLLGKMVHNLLASGKMDEADTLVSGTESDLCLVSSLEGNEQLTEVEETTNGVSLHNIAVSIDYCSLILLLRASQKSSSLHVIDN